MLETYRGLLRIRRFEETLLTLKDGGEIPGSIHLCIGQEAIPTGACRALRPDDYVTTTYRGHGWALAHGVAPAALFAEIMGRDSSLCGGRGASVYFSDLAHAFIGENSIVGAGAPIAAGAAHSCVREGRDRVSLVSFGDGAMNQGVLLETLNIAAVMSLPLIFVCENNGYSEMTPIVDLIGTASLVERAQGFGVPGVCVDGNDPDAVHTTVETAVARARTGEGPTFIEATTERLVGHFSGDAQHYRPPGEVDRARLVEPIVRFRAQALRTHSEKELAHVEDSVEDEIAGALTAARACPLPDPATALEHVYA